MPKEPAPGHFLYGKSVYSILKFIGEGCFGKVAKCRSMATKKIVAIKILKQHLDLCLDTKREMEMLEVISALDTDRSNVVKFFECFKENDQTCLAFEMLDKSLYDLMKANHFKPMSLQEIRPIAQQLLVALNALKGVGVIHGDIKPDNIMLVDHQNQPFKIKLIDFGQAMKNTEAMPWESIQPIGYRAPEVILGLPYDEAIDVWGVACVLAFMYLRNNLFPIHCEYQMMKCMVELFGMPDEVQLLTAIYTQKYFYENEGDPITWRLLTPEEYKIVNEEKPKGRGRNTHLRNSLDDLLNIYPKRGPTEFEDRKAFVDLLKRLLHPDCEKRISPREALRHPFITMSHLSGDQWSKVYLNKAQTLMSVCISGESADTEISPASSPERVPSPGSSINSDDDSDEDLFGGDEETLASVNKPPSETSSKHQSSSDEENPAQSPTESVWSLSDDDDSDSDSADELSAEELPRVTNLGDMSTWSSVEDLTALSDRDDRVSCSSKTVQEKGAPIPGCVNEELSSDEDLLTLSSMDDLDSWTSDQTPAREDIINVGEKSSFNSAEDVVSSSSDGDQSKDSTDFVSVSPGWGKKILQRIRSFFKRIADIFSCSRVED